MKNRFAIKDDRKNVKSKTVLAQDFVDLVMRTRDIREGLPSRNLHSVQGTKTELEVEKIDLHSKGKQNGRGLRKWIQTDLTSHMKCRRNGSRLTGRRSGKLKDENSGDIFEDTIPLHPQLRVKTQAKEKTQTLVEGTNPALHRNSVETMLERQSHLRIIPLSESGMCAQNPSSVPLRAEPGIEYNIFYLLSGYGDDIYPLNAIAIDTMNTTRRQLIPWSCSRAWFLCSVQKNGFPWNIRRLEDARRILNSSLVTAYIPDYILKEKLLDISRACDFPRFIEREYGAYRDCKFRTLHFVGYFSMKKYMGSHKERHTSGRPPYQSLKWENNSCALDALLFVLPQICYSVISNQMYRSKMAGSDPCFHSPVAFIFAALEAVQSEDMELSLTSNWARHLFMDIIQYVRPQHNMYDAQASWSSFVRPQEYLDLSSVLLYIPYLLGKGSPAFRNLQVPGFLEVSMYFIRATFENSRQGKDLESLGALLFASIVLAAQDTKQQISESIYIFALTFAEEDVSSSVFKRWLQKMFLTSWNYESKRKESNLPMDSESDVSNKEKAWRFETLGLIGCSSTTSNHFVSLLRSSNSQDSVWFYDGLKENGLAKCLPTREALSLSNPKVEMEGLFVISSVILLGSVGDTRGKPKRAKW